MDPMALCGMTSERPRAASGLTLGAVSTRVTKVATGDMMAAQPHTCLGRPSMSCVTFLESSGWASCHLTLLCRSGNMDAQRWQGRAWGHQGLQSCFKFHPVMSPHSSALVPKGKVTAGSPAWLSSITSSSGSRKSPSDAVWWKGGRPSKAFDDAEMALRATVTSGLVSSTGGHHVHQM